VLAEKIYKGKITETAEAEEISSPEQLTMPGRLGILQQVLVSCLL
jgi:hypothetical protein